MSTQVVILTALPVERKAVRAHLTGLDEYVLPNGTIYDMGTFTSNKGHSLQIAVVQMGMGNTTAALMAQQAIDHFSPDLLFFVGVAGGLKDVKPGDVVISNKVYLYASGKIDSDNEFYARPETGLATFSLIQRAHSVEINELWQKRIKKVVPIASQQAHVGAIAAGEQVIASKDAPVIALLHKHYNDVLAIEMEGFGVTATAQVNRHVETIVIRGISDTLVDKYNLDGHDFQAVAADHACAFAFEMLDRLADERAGTTSNQAAAPSNSRTTVSQTNGHVASLRVCYSYHPKDQALIEDLKKHFVQQVRFKKITVWDATQILAGAEGQSQLDNHLAQDDLFILGVSSDYIFSDDHYHQMEKALEQRERGAAVIPIQLKSVDPKELPTQNLLMLPRNGQAVSLTSHPEETLKLIADEIKKVINDRLGPA